MMRIDRVRIPRKAFNKAYLPYLEATEEEQIFFGGSASGKSVFLAQRCVYDLLRGGRNYLVLRKVAKSIRSSAFTEIMRVVNAWGLRELFDPNLANMMITCANGYQIIFTGLDDVEKLKSIIPTKGVLTDVWVEEATETDKYDIEQLKLRQRGGSEKTPKRITLSFNPIFKTSWIYTYYFEKIAWADDQTKHEADDLLILKTTYKNNRFLTKSDRERYENQDDPYLYNVYTLGNWGVLGNVIFKNWKVVDLNDNDSEYYLPEAQRTNRKHGLDFGFSADPAAVVLTHYDKKHKRIYIYDELYEKGLTNPELADELEPKIGKDYITADSSEPKSIVELNMRGINAIPAKKGPDSVNFGIQWLQQKEIIVDKSCINMRNELSTYKWKEDKNGNPLPKPVDRDNHLIDALRYAYEDEMIEYKVVQMESLYK